jgi:hypothetical protein
MNVYAFLSRIGCRTIVRWLYRIEVLGGENIPQAGGCIIASNHESLTDPFILGSRDARDPLHGEVGAFCESRHGGDISLPARFRWSGGGDRRTGEAAELLRRGEGASSQGTTSSISSAVGTAARHGLGS